MSWVLQEIRVGTTAIGVVDTEERVVAGTVLPAYDAPNDEYADFIYLQGVENTATDSVVVYDEENFTTTLATGEEEGALAIAMAPVDSTEKYGWYRISGSSALASVVGEVAQYATRTAAAAATVLSSVTVIETKGYSTKGDGGHGTYLQVSSQPSHDGWFQTANGLYFELDSETPNVAQFGAKDDLREVTDAAGTAASTTITSATAAFTSDDVGKRIIIAGLGQTQADNGDDPVDSVDVDNVAVRGVIGSVTNATTIELDSDDSDTVVFSGSSKRMWIYTDATQAVVQCFKYAAAKGRYMTFPTGTWGIGDPYTYRMTAGDSPENYGLLRVTGDICGIQGEGRDVSIVIWDEPVTANEENINFFNGQSSDTSPLVGEFTIRDVKFRGTLQFYTEATSDIADSDDADSQQTAVKNGIRGGSFCVPRSLERFTVENCQFEYLRAQACWTFNSRQVLYLNNICRYIPAGSLLTAGSEWVTVANNQISFGNDDSVSIGSKDPSTLGVDAGASARPVQTNAIVTGNNIFFAPGFKVVGAQSAVISNNTTNFSFRHGVHVQVNAYTATGQFGFNSTAGVSVVGNTFLNHLDRENLDTGGSGGSAIWISDDGATAGASDLDAIPGDGDGAGTVVSFYGTAANPYISRWATSGDDAIGPFHGVVIANNAVVRTMPNATNWSDYGYDFLPMNEEGLEWDPAISDAALRPIGIRMTGRRLRNIKITGNIIAGVLDFITLGVANSPSTDEICISETTIENNTFWDCSRTGLRFAGSPAAGVFQIDFRGNRWDGDPLHHHSGRNNGNGTWSSGSDMICLDAPTATRGLRFTGDTFANWSAINAGSSEFYFKDCVFEGEHDNQDGTDNTRGGIGLFPDADGSSFIYRHVSTNPNDATFGACLNDCVIAADDMPSSGYYLENHFVRNTSESLGTQSLHALWGWLRLTNGSGHTLNTDWAEVHVALRSGVVVPSVGSGAIADVTNNINTRAEKIAGYIIFDSSNQRLMVATGDADADDWAVADGSATVTPA